MSDKYTMSTILASNGVQALGKTLHLNDKQIMKAQSSALSLSSNANLRNCDPMSLIKYCYETARFDFAREDAVYPIPYGGKVQAQIGYQGFRELAMRTGKFSKVDCVEVKECDEIITNEDGEPEVIFEKNFLKRKDSKRVGFYGYARNAQGKLIKSIFMTDKECIAHGKRYSLTFNNAKGLWQTDFEKMSKKTIIKQLCKDLDCSEEINEAVKADQLVFGRENEANTYADNPQNRSRELVLSLDDIETKKTTVTNSLANKVNLKEDDQPIEEIDKTTGEVIEATPTKKQPRQKTEEEKFQEEIDDLF